MIGEESIRYSLRNLEHRKGRSFLTVFSILVGIMTIFIFISFGLGLFNYTKSFTEGSSIDKVLVLAKGGGAPGMSSIVLDDDDLEIVEKVAGVKSATGIYFEVAEIEKRDKKLFSYVVSYDPQNDILLDIFDVEAEKGRLLLPNDDGKVVLGYNYMIDGKIFDRGLDINEDVEINGEKLKIVGFFESVGNPQDDSQVYVTNEYFEKLFPGETYSQLAAQVELNIMDKVIENIEKKLRKHRGLEEGKEDFYVQSFEDMIESYGSILNIVIGFIILIALISVMVSAVNTANTMITSVLERYREIGILKAVGAKNSEIFGIFLFESSFLGFLAGVLGVLIGFIITTVAGLVLNNLGWGFLQPSYSYLFSYDIFVYCILFAVLTGTVSGVLPAIRASKINTVDALRYE